MVPSRALDCPRLVVLDLLLVVGFDLSIVLGLDTSNGLDTRKTF